MSKTETEIERLLPKLYAVTGAHEATARDVAEGLTVLLDAAVFMEVDPDTSRFLRRVGNEDQAEATVAAVLAEHFDQGNPIMVSQPKLARCTGLSASTVRRVISRLAAGGHIEIIRPTDAEVAGGDSALRYRLNIAA